MMNTFTQRCKRLAGPRHFMASFMPDDTQIGERESDGHQLHLGMED